MRGENRNRDRLHLTKLDAFARWAAQHGYVREPTKGTFEVLRLRLGANAPLLYYRHLHGVHATSTGAATNLVSRWFRERARERGAREEIRA